MLSSSVETDVTLYLIIIETVTCKSPEYVAFITKLHNEMLYDYFPAHFYTYKDFDKCFRWESLSCLNQYRTKFNSVCAGKSGDSVGISKTFLLPLSIQYITTTTLD
ncbi:uncharacterized protein LOC128249758 isoform X2 [Octopus bimaculoides]|uniref:uncharacterized protein LOC128249758 isoform X2 n=1 Tax=Octopus bimaculoides TaxID=37653 RepID=UPI0022E3896F|nr:uncharacterized protein LOC128249758 isoform X2 [Octopus bimaculoides]